jgi:hypothetical protein
MNYDGENMNRPSVSAQNECETLMQKNQTYAGNNHHDEDVGRNQSVYAQSGSLVN